MQEGRAPGFEMSFEDDTFVGKQVKSGVRPRSPEETRALLRAQVWQLGKSPLSSVFSSLVMMYLSGSHLSIMSLMLCVMMLSSPLKALFAFRSSFAPFDAQLPAGDSAVLRSKLVYVAVNGAVLCVAVWKTLQLGILPLTPEDWLRYAPALTTNTVMDTFVKI